MAWKPSSDLAALLPSLPGSPDPGHKDAYLGYIRYLTTVCGYDTVYLVKGSVTSPHGPISSGESSGIDAQHQDVSGLFDSLDQQPEVHVLEPTGSTGAPDPDEVLREFIDVLVEMDGWSKTQRWIIEGTENRHDLRDMGIDSALLDLLFWMQNATALGAQLVCPTPRAVMIPSPPTPGLAPEPMVKAIARFLLSHVAASPQDLPSPKNGDPSTPSLPTATHETILNIRQNYAAAARIGAKSECESARQQMQNLIESWRVEQPGENGLLQHLWWLDESSESGFHEHDEENPLSRYFQRFKKAPYPLVTTEPPPGFIHSPDPLIPEPFRWPSSATGGIESVSAWILNWRDLAAD